MAGFQVRAAAEIDSLKKELDIFSEGPPPLPELIVKGLYPPLPICSDILIWGFEILRSAKRQGVRQMNCQLVPACPPAEMLALALKLENRAGDFTWLEKQRMLGFLAAAEGSSGQLNELFLELSPLIENHPDSLLATKILTFTNLPQSLRELVAEGQIDLKSAARVQSLPAEVFQLLRTSSLTFSQRRQFLNELFESSRKLALAGKDVATIARQALEGRQPLDTIHGLRFPALTATEKQFAALEQDLLKGSGVRLQPPPYFEGDAFTVAFEFNSAKSFRRKLEALNSLEGRLDALFELL
ncbi:MAG: hypothetical protein JSV89_16335 [Spirochaetaceae bacterium]|nr:MAG: hypothetical protein JSV89_16335 [Spirochaetaceae bacterium]